MDRSCRQLFVMLIIALYCLRLVSVQKRLGQKMRKSTIIMLAAMLALLSGTADSTYYVKPGQSIQAAINAASPGQIVEVQNGTYNERVNVTKPLTLKGLGEPIVNAGGKGSAITISANGSTLLGFTAVGSGKGWNDAGIKVLSRENIIKDNAALKNNNFGILLYHAGNNTVASNVAEENKNAGILLVHSNGNQLWGNDIIMNLDGISIQTSRSNVVKANNLTMNKIGINISNYNFSDSIRASTSGNGKGVSIKYSPTSEATSYSINKMSTGSPDINLLYQNNLQDNERNAFDDGSNQWDNGKAGNHYSSYDAREDGCKDRNRDGICDSGYSIPGGRNVDKFPKASIDAILSYKSKGLMGSMLKIDHRTYLPGSDVDVTYLAPKNFSGWVGVVKADFPRGYVDKKGSLAYQSITGTSGLLNLKAPKGDGSYNLRMYNASGGELVDLDFHVNVPTINATPISVNACEMVTINYLGAPGYENDWIAMYKSGSPDGSYVTRQYLNGKENGTVTLEAPDPGSYNFRLFENDSFTKLATSNDIVAKAMAGNKVIASPSHVGTGGTVTVTYWGAPPEGTGVIGMYGVNRPDKFYLDMRPIGSKSCGSITWQLPGPGQYDFRMFRSEITDVGQGAYQILGQSNVVTVG
jgi:nitrous oxidase accessory protein